MLITKKEIIENTIEWLKHFELISDDYKPGQDELLEKSIDLLHALDYVGFKVVKIYRNDEDGRNIVYLTVIDRNSSIKTSVSLNFDKYSNRRFECNVDFIDDSMLWDKEDKRAFQKRLREEGIKIEEKPWKYSDYF